MFILDWCLGKFYGYSISNFIFVVFVYGFLFVMLGFYLLAFRPFLEVQSTSMFVDPISFELT